MIDSNVVPLPQKCCYINRKGERQEFPACLLSISTTPRTRTIRLLPKCVTKSCHYMLTHGCCRPNELYMPMLTLRTCKPPSRGDRHLPEHVLIQIPVVHDSRRADKYWHAASGRIIAYELNALSDRGPTAPIVYRPYGN